MKWIFLISFAFLLASCEKKQEEEKLPPTIGKYVYIDDMDILHSRESCIRLKFGNDDNGHKIYGKRILESESIILGENQRFCTRCIDDDVYEKLMSISNRNSVEADRNEIKPPAY